MLEIQELEQWQLKLFQKIDKRERGVKAWKRVFLQVALITMLQDFLEED